MGKKKGFDLDKIDKILSQFPDEGPGDAKTDAGPPKPALKPGKPPTSQEQQTPDRPPRPRPSIGAWVRAVAGVALALAITQWPYGNACGLGLFLYLAAVAAVLAAGAWAATHAWRMRLAIPHMVGLGVILWGGVIGLMQVLPRVGYAKVDAAWMCETAVDAPATEAVPAAVPTVPAQEAAALADSAVQGDSVAQSDAVLRADSALAIDSTAAADSAAQPGSVPATSAKPSTT